MSSFTQYLFISLISILKNQWVRFSFNYINYMKINIRKCNKIFTVEGETWDICNFPFMIFIPPPIFYPTLTHITVNSYYIGGHKMILKSIYAIGCIPYDQNLVNKVLKITVKVITTALQWLLLDYSTMGDCFKLLLLFLYFSNVL